MVRTYGFHHNVINIRKETTMSERKQTYPKRMGAVIWLLYMTLLWQDSNGSFATDLDVFSEISSVPKSKIMPALKKLVKYKFIHLKKTGRRTFVIKLNYFGED
jgi:hypothetical protein